MKNKKELLGDELRSLEGISFVKESAVFSRDGQVIMSKLSQVHNLESFAVMVSFAKAVLETATTLLGEGVPQRVIIQNKNCNMVIVGAGSKALLIIITDSCFNPRLLEPSMARAANTIKQILE